MKDISAIMNETDMGYYTLLMEDIMTANGSQIRCMDLVSYSIKMEKQPMKGIGKMISLMDKVGSTTWSQNKAMKSLTTKIFQSLEIGGFIMKDYLKLIQNMEKDISS